MWLCAFLVLCLVFNHQLSTLNYQLFDTPMLRKRNIFPGQCFPKSTLLFFVNISPPGAHLRTIATYLNTQNFPFLPKTAPKLPKTAKKRQELAKTAKKNDAKKHQMRNCAPSSLTHLTGPLQNHPTAATN